MGVRGKENFFQKVFSEAYVTDIGREATVFLIDLRKTQKSPIVRDCIQTKKALSERKRLRTGQMRQRLQGAKAYTADNTSICRKFKNIHKIR